MSVSAVAFLVALALLTGAACQFIGRSSASYEWEIGAVGALYASLLANGMLASRLAPAFGFDGVAVVPVLLGALFGGGVVVLGFRQFGSPIAPHHAAQFAPALPIRRRVRLAFSPVLVEQPILDRMRRQFGVTATIQRMDITRNQGWIELTLVGAAPAIDAAVALAMEAEERAPALAA